MSIYKTVITENVLSPNLTSNVNLFLNNTAFVVGTDFAATSLNQFHANAAIWLKDTISGDGTIYWRKINATDGDLYFSNAVVITTDNAVDELANVYINYPSNVSNIIVTGGYINFFNGGNTNQGPGGVGLRYANNHVQFNSNGTWYNIDSISTVSLDELADVEITNASNNQLLTWNSNIARWINANLVIQNDTNPTLGGDLNMGNYDLVIGNSGNLNIVDNSSNHYTVVSMIQNSNTGTGSNYLTFANNVSGSDPIISADGDDIDVGITLQTKNDGNIVIDTNGGNTYVNSTFLELTGFQKSSIYRTSTFGGYTPATPWSIPINTDTILLDFTANSTSGTYYANVGAGLEGQKLNFIFYSDNPLITGLVDFGANKLGSGNGLSTKLEMKKSGQGASLIYLGTPDIWQILNSGAAVK
jgi:hypothetical protein